MGSWQDVQDITREFDVTMELMVNHISPASHEVWAKLCRWWAERPGGCVRCAQHVMMPFTCCAEDIVSTHSALSTALLQHQAKEQAREDCASVI